MKNRLCDWTLSIKLWHIFIAIGICLIILVLGLIPVYLLHNNPSEKDVEGIYNNVFRIKWFNVSFNSYERSVLSINNEFPAPTIIVEKGDIINITIINESFESTIIHWHV